MLIVQSFSYQHAYSNQHFYLIFKKFPSNMLIPSNSLNGNSRVHFLNIELILWYSQKVSQHSHCTKENRSTIKMISKRMKAILHRLKCSFSKSVTQAKGPAMIQSLSMLCTIQKSFQTRHYIRVIHQHNKVFFSI